MDTRLPIANGLLTFFLVVLLNPFGTGFTPDSSAYFRMAEEARTKGFFAITNGWHSPGFPWVVALFTGLLGRDFGFTCTIINAVSLGAVAAGLTREALFFRPSPWPRPFYGFLLAVMILGSVLQTGIHSGILLMAWSEAPFLASTTLGLLLLARWRRGEGADSLLGWSLLSFVFAWMVRLPGIFGIPVIAVTVLLVALSDRQRLIRTIRASAPHLVASLGLVAAVIQFNQHQFGHWMRTTHPGVGPSVWVVTANFFGTYLSYFIPHRGDIPKWNASVASLTLALGWGLGAIVLGLLLMALWSFWARSRVTGSAWRDLVTATVGLPVEWIVWVLVYSAGMLYFMSTTGIFGTNRFVSPIFGAMPIFLAFVFCVFSTRHAMRGTAVVMSVLMAVGAAEATIALRGSRQRAPERISLETPGIRGTAAFKELAREIEAAPHVYWIRFRDQDQWREAVLRVMFPDKNIETVSASDLARRPLDRALALTFADSGSIALLLSSYPVAVAERHVFQLTVAEVRNVVSATAPGRSIP